ncbi:Hercynylcysteine sulfoxide lyase [Porphyridium purpureum]|uniref:Hercynylcysteine sulfoxide lyase n=1 Tax=Porphyridium purpureum TaxID=35688 RepID=A0A5J4Z106_PORPP|nr:Hercynylcysteine sulfoxide lyase [Porphyridium purpureum]|eukprot:POR4633..scf295_1
MCAVEMDTYEKVERALAAPLLEGSDECVGDLDAPTRDFERRELQRVRQWADDNDKRGVKEPGRGLFMLDPAVTFLAHGSYGAVSACVYNIGVEWRLLMERQPVRFFYDTLYPYIVRSLRSLAAHFGLSRASNLALVPNVEFGVQSVLRSLRLAADDLVVSWSDILYGANMHMLRVLQHEQGFQLALFPIAAHVPLTRNGPDEQDAFVEYVVAEIHNAVRTSAASQFKRVVCFFEHVSSPSAIVFPLAKLCRAFREHDVISVVDGAHALGMFAWRDTPLDAMHVDFYVTNAHKWLCNLRGAAVLYVASEEMLRQVRPLVISWGFPRGFQSSFIWTGTLDYTPFITLWAALRVFDLLGGVKNLGARNKAPRAICMTFCSRALQLKCLHSSFWTEASS